MRWKPRLWTGTPLLSPPPSHRDSSSGYAKTSCCCCCIFITSSTSSVTSRSVGQHPKHSVNPPGMAAVRPPPALCPISLLLLGEGRAAHCMLPQTQPLATLMFLDSQIEGGAGNYTTATSWWGHCCSLLPQEVPSSPWCYSAHLMACPAPVWLSAFIYSRTCLYFSGLWNNREQVGRH